MNRNRLDPTGEEPAEHTDYRLHFGAPLQGDDELRPAQLHLVVFQGLSDNSGHRSGCVYDHEIGGATSDVDQCGRGKHLLEHESLGAGGSDESKIVGLGEIVEIFRLVYPAQPDASRRADGALPDIGVHVGDRPSGLHSQGHYLVCQSRFAGVRGTHEHHNPDLGGYVRSELGMDRLGHEAMVTAFGMIETERGCGRLPAHGRYSRRLRPPEPVEGCRWPIADPNTATVAAWRLPAAYVASRLPDMSDPLPISFLSDFGLDDEFVGVVHGVIARIAPDVRVIDVTHGIARGDVRAGALALMRAIQYLPEGVALAVVDPGVGTDRRAIAAETPWGYFVGPDNGLLSPAAAIVGGSVRAVRLDNPDLVLPSAGATFEGRDRFAPAAAVLASGQATLDELGPVIAPDELTPMVLPLPAVGEASVEGEAWWVDAFGNVQLNVGPDDLRELGVSEGQSVDVIVGPLKRTATWVRSYGDVEPGTPLLHVDSAGMLALAVREGSGADFFVLRAGGQVVLRKP